MKDAKTESPSWRIFQGTGQPHDGIDKLPDPPPWRNFSNDRVMPKFEVKPEHVELVNAAIYLRRPLLVTGDPGTGKSTLAYAIAYELKLGTVLDWRITTRSTLQDGLYSYDAIGWAAQVHTSATLLAPQTGVPETAQSHLTQARLSADIGNYIKLGPLGTALLPTKRPRVLLIDEIDKGDIDLPNDLLHAFETGRFEIPELVRLSDNVSTVQVRPHDSNSRTVTIQGGHVRCQEFPIVVLTSNVEREFPPAFLRRCIPLGIDPPNEDQLKSIVSAHLGEASVARDKLIDEFLKKRRDKAVLATDQLLNAVYLATHHEMMPEALLNAIFRALGERPHKP